MNSFQNQLSNVQLRKPTTIHDTSAPKLKGFVSEKDIADYQRTVLESNIERWIEPLESANLTFPTKFTEITIEDAKLLVRINEANENQLGLSENDQDHLNELEKRLQQTIDLVRRESDDGVFVKTSSRSAKDAPLATKRLVDLYEKYREGSDDENQKLKAILQAGTECLKVANAHDALELITHSERIVQDMNLALEHLDRWNENFVVRRWANIDVDMEFRGFYCNGKLNALSQYNHTCYFERVERNQSKIIEILLNCFYTKVQPTLAPYYDCYVVDFAITGKDLDQVWVIELNPFLSSTDGALFSWNSERSILENGPFEFRFNQAFSPGSICNLVTRVREILQQSNKQPKQ